MEKTTNNKHISPAFIIWLLTLAAKYTLLPFLTIWAVNTLFNIDISFSFKSWAALIILMVFLKITSEGIHINFNPPPDTYEDYDDDYGDREEILRKVQELNKRKSRKKSSKKSDWNTPA